MRRREQPHSQFPQVRAVPRSAPAGPRSLFPRGPPARSAAVNPCPQFAVSPSPQFAVSPQLGPAVPACPQFPQFRPLLNLQFPPGNAFPQ
jgi:hypothetical protein